MPRVNSPAPESDSLALGARVEAKRLFAFTKRDDVDVDEADDDDDDAAAAAAAAEPGNSSDDAMDEDAGAATAAMPDNDARGDAAYSDINDTLFAGRSATGFFSRCMSMTGPSGADRLDVVVAVVVDNAPAAPAAAAVVVVVNVDEDNDDDVGKEDDDTEEVRPVLNIAWCEEGTSVVLEASRTRSGMLGAEVDSVLPLPSELKALPGASWSWEPNDDEPGTVAADDDDAVDAVGVNGTAPEPKLLLLLLNPYSLSPTITSPPPPPTETLLISDKDDESPLFDMRKACGLLPVWPPASLLSRKLMRFISSTRVASCTAAFFSRRRMCLVKG